MSNTTYSDTGMKLNTVINNKTGGIKMKVGRLCKVVDGGVCVMINPYTGKIVPTNDIVTDRIHKIVATNCVLPDSNGGRSNDTIIQAAETSNVNYVNSKYLVPIDCPHIRKFADCCCFKCCPCCN